MSSQGESCSKGSGNTGPSKITSAHSIWVHVVPHFFGVLITMSPDRNSNPSQRALSSTSDRSLTVSDAENAGLQQQPCPLTPPVPSPGSGVPAPGATAAGVPGRECGRTTATHAARED